MAIQQSKKQADLEKRLRILHKQVYGKQEFTPGSATAASSDVKFLYRDLLKILIFSTFAIGIQILLFFLLKGGE